MKTSHLIIGAAAVAAVGLFVYSRSKAPKASTAAVASVKLTPLEQARAAAQELLDSAKKLGSSLGVSTSTDSPPSTSQRTVDLEGDIPTARASAARTHILYAEA